jgi:colanic acid/amylovoran biosynthesis glycosyltransferase
MKILFIVEHFPCISETFVLNQVTGLLDLGHDVTIYAIGKQSGIAAHPAINDYNLMDRTWAGINPPTSKRHRLIKAMRFFPSFFSRCGFNMFKAFDYSRHGKQAINFGFFYSCLSLINHNTHFDIIHCHFGDKGLLALAWRDMGLITGAISTVFHAQELVSLSDCRGRNLYRRLFRSNTLLLPVSKRWEDKLVSWGAKSEWVTVHHMGVDLKIFPYSEHNPDPNAVINILTIGRLIEKKGHEYALRAIAELSQLIDRKLQYSIIGSGPLELYLKSLATELGIADIVNFVGSMPQDIVQSYLANAHIFLLPSVTAENNDQEGIPVALMEAMASGLPVISTRHSGIPELVEHTLSGFLAEEREIVSITNTISRLILDPSLFSNIAINGRKKVEEEFDLEKLNFKLQELFKLEIK